MINDNDYYYYDNQNNKYCYDNTNNYSSSQQPIHSLRELPHHSSVVAPRFQLVRQINNLVKRSLQGSRWSGGEIKWCQWLNVWVWYIYIYNITIIISIYIYIVYIIYIYRYSNYSYNIHIQYSIVCMYIYIYIQYTFICDINRHTCWLNCEMIPRRDKMDIPRAASRLATKGIRLVV